jgi:hypothetical protein
MSQSSPRHRAPYLLSACAQPRHRTPKPRAEHRRGCADDAQCVGPLRWDELGAFLMTALAAALLLAFSASLTGCQRHSSSAEQTQVTGELTPTPSSAPSNLGAGPADLRSFDTGQPAPGAPGERPSIAENMGRNFQGTLLVRAQGGFGSEELRYLSHGNTARLQIDTLEAKPGAPTLHFDALIEGENISVFDHQRRTVRVERLADVRPRKAAASNADAKVQIKETGTNRELQGAPCEVYEIRSDGLDIDACVGALPGSFDVDKLETVSGVDVPGWLRTL